MSFDDLQKEVSVCQSAPLAIAIVKSTIVAVMIMARNLPPLQTTTVDAKRPNQFHPAFKSSYSTTSSRSEPDLSPLNNKMFSFQNEIFFFLSLILAENSSNFEKLYTWNISQLFVCSAHSVGTSPQNAELAAVQSSFKLKS